MRSGRIRVDFYESDRTYVSSAILGAGDLMLLNTGGHGFEVLENTDMIEIKQGRTPKVAIKLVSLLPLTKYD